MPVALHLWLGAQWNMGDSIMNSRGRQVWSATVMVYTKVKWNVIVYVVDLQCLFSLRQGGKLV